MWNLINFRVTSEQVTGIEELFVKITPHQTALAWGQQISSIYSNSIQCVFLLHINTGYLTKDEQRLQKKFLDQSFIKAVAHSNLR